MPAGRIGLEHHANDFCRSCRDKKEDETVLQLLETFPTICKRKKGQLRAYCNSDLVDLFNIDFGSLRTLVSQCSLYGLNESIRIPLGDSHPYLPAVLLIGCKSNRLSLLITRSMVTPFAMLLAKCFFICILFWKCHSFLFSKNHYLDSCKKK